MTFYRKHAKLRMWGKFPWNQIAPDGLQDLIRPPQAYCTKKGEWMTGWDLHEPHSQDHTVLLNLNMAFQIQSLNHSLGIHLAHQTPWVISNNEWEHESRPVKKNSICPLVICPSYQLSNIGQILSIIKNKKHLLRRKTSETMTSERGWTAWVRMEIH